MIWRDYKLNLAGLAVVRIFSGLNLIEMVLKLKESEEERTELNLTFSSNSFGDLVSELKKIADKVRKKNFEGKSLKYDFSSGVKAELNLYFNKDEFIKFYEFLETCKKQAEEQEKEYKKLTKEGE